MSLPSGFVDDLRAALGDAFVLTEPEQLATYDCDGLTGWRAQPAAVVLPGSTEDVQAVLRLCAREGDPVRRARRRHGPLGRGAPGRGGHRRLASRG